jgi:hypothetical protein
VLELALVLVLELALALVLALALALYGCSPNASPGAARKVRQPPKPEELTQRHLIEREIANKQPPRKQRAMLGAERVPAPCNTLRIQRSPPS